MTVIDILAIVGALSWTYPLIVWLDKRLTRTQLEIINHKKLQVGYTSFGPILNIDLAFSASKDDAFVKEVAVVLRHESNQTENFKWEWFEENLMEIEIPDTGGIVPYKKNQKAVALKVLTNTLTEKKVGFQKPLFHDNYSAQYQSTFEVYQNFDTKNGDINELRRSKEFNDFEHFFRNNFIWKVGKYNGTIMCKVANSKEVFKKDIEFYLTSLDIRKLENNIQLCLDTLENHFITRNPDIKVFWNWTNPLDTKRNNAS
jgi:hypothetical protein